MVTTTPARKQNSFFVKSRALLLFLVFLIALALFIMASIHYDSATHFTANDGDMLSINGAPGELITVSINAGSSVDGHWASQNGLRLSLNSSPNFSAQIVAPREADWSDSISTSADNPDDPIMLTGSITLPASINTHAQAITGQISGDVEYPQDEGFLFSNSSTNLLIHVQIIPTDASMTFLSTQLPLYLVTGLGAILLLVLPGIFRFYDIRRKPPFASL